MIEHDKDCNVRLGFHKGEICNCHPKPMEKHKKVARHPKSRCVCGHTGDGANSDHKDTLNPGHGSCRICKCPRFRWVSFFDIPRSIFPHPGWGTADSTGHGQPQ